MSCVTKFYATLEAGSYSECAVLGRNEAGKLCKVTVANSPVDVVAVIGCEGREVGDPFGEVYVEFHEFDVIGATIAEANLSTGTFWFVENEEDPDHPFVQMSVEAPSNAVLQIPERLRPYAVNNDGTVMIYVRPKGM